MAETKSLSEYRAGYQRLLARVKNAREASIEVGERALGGGVAVAAGYGVGVAVKKGWDRPIPNTEVPIIPAVAAVIAIAGVADFAGRMSTVAVHAGSGALAGYAAIKASR